MTLASRSSAHREGRLGASGDFTVATEVWLSALKRLQQVLETCHEHDTRVVLKLRCNELRILSAGIEMVVPAEGEGEGQAVFDVAQLQRLATVARFLRPKTVRIWVSEDILRIDSTAIDCEWVDENGFSGAGPLPIGASLAQVLQLRYRYKQPELVAERLDGRVFEAECRKAELVARAAEILKPLGISMAALDHFVINTIRESIKEKAPEF